MKKNTIEAIILAGGFGLRLKEVVDDIPKVMAPVNGRPFLEYILDYLYINNFNHLVFSVGYKNEIIKEHFKNEYKGMRIDYAIEKEPLGTGGGIKLAFQYIEGPRAIVLNGDTMFRIDYDRIYRFHFSSNSNFSIVLREVDNVDRFGAVETNEDGLITGFSEKNEKRGKGKINGGIYLIEKEFFTDLKFPDKFSIEKDGFEKYCDQYNFYGILSKGYFIDIGIPADYLKAQDEFKKFEN